MVRETIGTRVEEIAQVKWLSGRFKASLRATTIRLIESGLASWDLYTELPTAADHKRRGVGGGGRDRTEIREDQLGKRTATLFRRAVDANVVTLSQALSYLDMPDSDFGRLSTFTLTISR